MVECFFEISLKFFDIYFGTFELVVPFALLTKNNKYWWRLGIYLRDHETTILHILGTEILGLFQIDSLSNFMLEMTTEHIPALSRSLFCCFLAIRKGLILKYRKFFEKEKINFVNVIVGW